MKENIIDIKAESLPWQAKFIGALFLIGALAVVMNNWWLFIILAVIGFALLSWHSGTQIDYVRKTFREYNSCLFIRRGVTENYNAVEKVYINMENLSQKMYTAHTNSSSTFRYALFNAYLKFDDGRKIFLTSRKNKARLIKLLGPLVAALAVNLTDNSA